MPYNLWKATNALNVEEQEYVERVTSLRFSTFTSCIGVIARTGSDLYGFHLVATGVGSRQERGAMFHLGRAVTAEPIDTAVIAKVLDLLPSKLDEAVLIGSIDTWRDRQSLGMARGKTIDPDSLLRQASYHKLCGELGNRCSSIVLEYTFGSGSYGGEIDATGSIETTY